MKTVMMGIALAALLGAAPVAMAKDTSMPMKSQSQSSLENANRMQNPDGTFQGKPVVQGPAHWQDADRSASSGTSSGESGSRSVSGSRSK